MSAPEHGQEPEAGDGVLHALLIGIDAYRPNRLPEGMEIRDLSGAVTDVLRIERFLRQGPLAVPECRIRKLLAPGAAMSPSKLAFDGFPTYQAMVQQLEALLERASPGDHVLIHYSGHGARVASTTSFKEWDECLVPTDAGRSHKLLHDVELYGHLQRLSMHGLRVTLVLDACHAGGVLRGDGRKRERTVGFLEGDWGPDLSSVGAWDHVRESWRESFSSGWRNVAAGRGPFPVPEGCVMIAACRPKEVARECLFDGIGFSGALTHYLLESTEALASGPTTRQLHQHLLGRIHSRFESQTPVLEGDGDILFLGEGRWPSLRGVPVLEVRKGPAPAVRLATGQVHGIAPGARFALRPPGLAGNEEQGAETVVCAKEVDGGWTWAEPEEPVSGRVHADAGWQAVLIDPGPRSLVRAVALDRPDGASAAEREAFDALRAELEPRESQMVELATDDRRADFRVARAERGGGLEVLDGSGERVVHQGRPLSVTDPAGAVAGLIGRLEHLARYRNLRDLENPDHGSPLHGALELELLTREKGQLAGRKGSPLVGGVALDEQLITLAIRNRSNLELNVVVVDFQPDWGIAQAHPCPAERDYEPVAPGGEILAPLDVYLPPELREGRDLLKVFATTGPVDFSWLMLPALGQPPSRLLRSARPRGPLERMFAAVGGRVPASRSVRPARVASRTWTTAEIELIVVRPGVCQQAVESG